MFTNFIDRCLDMIPLISNGQNVIQAVQICTVNSHKLDACVSELVASRSASRAYAVMLSTVLGCILLYMYSFKQRSLLYKSRISTATERKDNTVTAQPIIESKKPSLGHNPSKPNVTGIENQRCKQKLQTKPHYLPKPSNGGHNYPPSYPELDKGEGYRGKYTPLPSRYLTDNYSRKIGTVDPYKYSAEVYQANTDEKYPTWKTQIEDVLMGSRESTLLVSSENESTPKRKKKPSVTLFKPKNNTSVDTKNVLAGLKDIDIGVDVTHKDPDDAASPSAKRKTNKIIIQNNFKEKVKSLTAKGTEYKMENSPEKHLSVQVALTAIGNNSPIKNVGSIMSKMNTNISNIKPFVPTPIIHPVKKSEIPCLFPGATTPRESALTSMTMPMMPSACGNSVWNRSSSDTCLNAPSDFYMKLDANVLSSDPLSNFRFDVPLKRSTCSTFSSPYIGSIWNEGPGSVAVSAPPKKICYP
jgi:hypothetical protein